MAGPRWVYSLQFRLILAFTATLALALTGAGLFVGFAAQHETEHFQRRSQEFRADRAHRLITRHYAKNRDWAGLQPTLEQAASLYGRRFIVTDGAGQVIGDSHRNPGRGGPNNRHNRDEEHRRWRPISVEGRQVGYLALLSEGENDLSSADSDWDNGGNGYGGKPDSLYAFSGRNGRPAGEDPAVPPAFPYFSSEEASGDFSLTPGPVEEPAAERMAAAVKSSLWWAGLVAGLGGILLVSLMARRILTPVQSLSVAARRLGQGDFSQRVPATSSSELEHLGQAFNSMAENLQAAEQQRRNLTADVAHELRTPLSNIQGYLEAVNDGLLVADAATINILRQQTDHLVALVEDLRLLVLAESGALRLSLQTESIGELLTKAAEAFRPRTQIKEISLSLQIDPDLPDIALDRTRIAQVVGNLLENAILHTPEGGAVVVAAEKRGSMAAVTISDTGPGIALEDLPLVFERFYRVDLSRARATGGVGLGLTIAKQLVEAHGGAIWADNRLDSGSQFTFTIPLTLSDPNLPNSGR